MQEEINPNIEYVTWNKNGISFLVSYKKLKLWLFCNILSLQQALIRNGTITRRVTFIRIPGIKVGLGLRLSLVLILACIPNLHCPTSSYLRLFMRCWFLNPHTSLHQWWIKICYVAKCLEILQIRFCSTSKIIWAMSWENLFMPKRTTKVQISLCICTAWSAPLLFAA